MKNIQRIIDNLDNVIEKSKQDALKTIYGNMKFRIFKSGEKKDESKIGNYSSQGYKTKRAKKGLQNNFIDLVFTGKLFTSVASNSIDKVYFKNEYGKEIGGYNEERFGRIFAPTKTEKEIFQEILNEEVNKLINGSN